MVTVIVLAGHDILAGETKIIASSCQDRMLLFPRALSDLLTSSSNWQSITTQVCIMYINDFLDCMIALEELLLKTIHTQICFSVS